MTAALFGPAFFFGLGGLALGVLTGLRYAAASQRLDDALDRLHRDADISTAAEAEDAQ